MGRRKTILHENLGEDQGEAGANMEMQSMRLRRLLGVPKSLKPEAGNSCLLREMVYLL